MRQKAQIQVFKKTIVLWVGAHKVRYKYFDVWDSKRALPEGV